MTSKEYTFEDWLNHKFYVEIDPFGEPVRNDSRNFIYLVFDGRMSYETLDKIQAIQEQTYSQILETSLEHEKEMFFREYERSPFPKEYHKKEIERIRNILGEVDQDVYHEVLRLTLERGIIKGATVITPNLYANPPLVAHYIAPNMKDSKAYDMGLPFEGELDYLRIHVFVKYLKWLEDGPGKQSTKSRTNGGKSFNWRGDKASDLPYLFRELRAQEIISSKTELEQFMKAFSGVHLSEIAGDIEWTASKALLSYFIATIVDKRLIDPAFHWAVAHACFADGKNLANSQGQYLNKKNGKPRYFQIVDAALKPFIGR